MSDGDGVTFSPETQPEQLAERGGEAAASGSADESVQVSERVLAANLQRQGWLSDADLDRARSLQSRRLPQILRDGRLLDEEALAALEREVDAAHPGITDTERDVALAKLLRDRDLVDPDALANAQSLLDRPLEEVIVSLGLVEAESLKKLKHKVAKARAKRKRAEREAAERTGPEAADQPPSGDSNPSGLGSGLGSPEAADPGGSIAGGVEALDEADEADASGEHAATSPAANGKRAGAQDAGQQPEMMRVPHDCGFVVKAPLDWGGRQGNCPKCGKPVRMPTLKQWRAQQQAIAEAQQMAQSYEAAELGAILVADGLISEETLQKAINVQAHEFGQMLVAQELLDEPTLREAERLSKELAQCNPAERKQRLEQIREDAKHDSQAGMAAFQQGDTPMIRVACPQCNFVVKGPEDWAGKSGQCPKCGHKVTMPSKGEVQASRQIAEAMAQTDLGQVLLAGNLISQAAMLKACQLQSRRLGEVLINESLADQAVIEQALEKQRKVRQAQEKLKRAGTPSSEELEEEIGGIMALPEEEQAEAETAKARKRSRKRALTSAEYEALAGQQEQNLVLDRMCQTLDDQRRRLKRVLMISPVISSLVLFATLGGLGYLALSGGATLSATMAPPPAKTPHTLEFAYYYDLNTGRIFVDPRERPPIPAPSGALNTPSGGQDAGVSAYLFACGGCEQGADRYVGWLEKYSGGFQPNSVPERQAGQARGVPLIRRQDGGAWVSADGEEGQRIVRDALDRCPGGIAPERCFPTDPRLSQQSAKSPVRHDKQPSAADYTR